jgi:hypothetical protein
MQLQKPIQVAEVAGTGGPGQAQISAVSPAVRRAASPGRGRTWAGEASLVSNGFPATVCPCVLERRRQGR